MPTKRAKARRPEDRAFLDIWLELKTLIDSAFDRFEKALLAHPDAWRAVYHDRYKLFLDVRRAAHDAMRKVRRLAFPSAVNLRDSDARGFYDVAAIERVRDRRGHPCAICGETRVHNAAHVVPRSIGGPADGGNLLDLCPNHHFLLDHRRLTREEWGHIDLARLSPAAQAYAREVILPSLEKFWNTKAGA